MVEVAKVPTPGPRDVLFRVEGCGVCASNLGPWFGLPWTQYPFSAGEGGHEAWGVVERVGEAVTCVKPGDRIAAISYSAYAEFDVAPENAVLVLPPALANTPFPGEALGCAFNIFARSRIEAGQTVAVIGAGFLGGLVTRLAAERGARVIAISRRQYSLALAHELGAAETIPLEDHHGIIERVRELTGGAFCDRVIEATGLQWPLDLGGELCKTRGTLVIAGYHQDGARQVNMQLWNWKGLDVVNAHERDTNVYVDGMRAAVAATLENRIAPARFVTHQFALSELDQAFALTATRPDGFIKAVVTP
jgi:threonine dehydrogenase-like Zn-dependent dehydrogenase